MNLLIIESPNKKEKIKKILGEGWEVAASVGHIRDLPLKELGIEKENGYKLQYAVTENKEKVVEGLINLVKRVGKENVFLATDPDREGESISFHLAKVLDLPVQTVKRVTFNEITEKCIKAAVASPRNINVFLVAAQECRRCVDRLVGYEVSPVLWQFIKGHSGLSAGRVQSVAVRLVVDREREIQKFIDKSKFNIKGRFQTINNEIIEGKLKDVALDDEGMANTFLTISKDKQFSIGDISSSEEAKQPGSPFSTSSLQQEAFSKLKFPVKKTMELAQRLFENGLITYMRTDSVNLSEDSIEEARVHIFKTYGEEYFFKRVFKNKSESAQEAHEAIRPTHFYTLESGLGIDEDKLYDLIYRRTVASQMASARFDKTTINIINDVDETLFVSTASILKFDGCLKAYAEENDEEQDNDNEENSSLLKFPIEKGDKLDIEIISAIQTYSKPPARYDQATIIKALEKKEIGRPSTYSSIISTIQSREYVKTENVSGKKLQSVLLELTTDGIKRTTTSKTIGTDKNKLIPTEVGTIVTEFLEKHFSDIVDYGFTAKIEADFDQVAEKKATYVDIIKYFDSELQKFILKTGGTSTLRVAKKELGCKCPKCTNGSILIGNSGFYCSEARIELIDEKKVNKGCNFIIWKTISGRTITEAEAKQLLDKKKTNLLKGFVGSKEKGSKPFEVHLVLNKDNSVGFLFPDKKDTENKPGGKQNSFAAAFGKKAK